MRAVTKVRPPSSKDLREQEEDKFLVDKPMDPSKPRKPAVKRSHERGRSPAKDTGVEVDAQGNDRLQPCQSCGHGPG